MMAELQHGLDWQGEDLAGWYASEKLDGCRAWWTGSALLTRSGGRIPAPSWFTEGWPALPMDGELFAGYGRWGDSLAACRYGNFKPGVRFMVFDVPQATGYWPERMREAARLLSGCVTASPVEWWTVESLDGLMARLKEIQDGGGEGIIVRHPRLRYRPGRTGAVQKLKHIDCALALR